MDCSGHIFQAAFSTLCILICLYLVKISSSLQRDVFLVCITAAQLYIVCAFFCTLRDHNIKGSKAQCIRIVQSELRAIGRILCHIAPSIVVVDIRYAVLTIGVLYKTSGGIARQFFCYCLFYIVCSNICALVDVRISDIRCTVFLIHYIAFLGLGLFVGCRSCALVSQIVIHVLIVVIGELYLVVTVCYQILTEDHIACDGSGHAAALCRSVLPALLLGISHRGQAEYTVVQGGYSFAVRQFNGMRTSLCFCVKDIIVIQLVVDRASVCERLVLGCNPVQSYLVQIVIISPLFRVDENIQCLGNITIGNVFLANLDLLNACALFFQDKVVRCAAVCGLIFIDRSRN